MKLAREDWHAALSLLDQALDLAPADRQAWLATLPPMQAHVRQALDQLLEDRRAIETGSFLNALPPLLSSVPDSSAGQHIGPYQLLRPLGQGGMARVWLARRSDGAHQREVALKLPFSGPHANLAAHVISERFVRERQILSALTHPHIASVLDAGHSGTQPWLAMEYINGQPITAWAEETQSSVPERLRLFLQVLQAVQHAHAQLVIHRDIKPSNVLVDTAGQAKLLDFGVAKLLGAEGLTADTELTQASGRALTPQYASPEQINGAALSTASDVYSLGVLLYELLSGRLPYVVKRSSTAALEQAIVQADIQRPSLAASGAATQRALRGDLDTIVQKAMHLRPALRYATAEAFSQDIQRHLQSLPILARPDTLAYRFSKLWSRQRLALSAAAAVAVAVVGGAGAALWQAQQARSEAARALAVQSFLLDIFKTSSARQADPQKARAVTARELLDIGASKIKAALADQPQARLAVLDALRQLYMELGLETKAAELARETVALAKATSGQDSEAHLAQLVNLANALQNTEQSAELQQVIDQGLGIANRLPNKPQVSRTKMFAEAAVFFHSRDVNKAAQAAQQALEQSRALGDPVLLAQTLEGAGLVAMARRDQAAAEALLGEAVALREKAAEPSSELVRSRVQLAELQGSRLSFDASLVSLRAALSETLRVNGVAHIDTSQTRMRLGDMLSDMGRMREAMAQFQPLQAELIAAATPDIYTLHILASSLGRAQMRLGLLAESEATLRRGVDMQARINSGARAAATLREYLVHTMLAQGRVDEAQALVQEAARLRLANGMQAGQRVWAPQAYAALAVARARQDVQASQHALAGLVAGSDGDSANSLPWVNGSLARAGVEVDLGQTALAAQRLDRLQKVLNEYGLIGRLPLIEGQRYTLCARIAVAAGASPQAAALFEQARLAYASELSETAPLMREWAQARAASLAAPSPSATSPRSQGCT